MSFYADEFWAAFEDAGMLVDCTFLQVGGDIPKTVKVGWREPDFDRINGTRTKQYEIEYRVADMPNLVEGTLLSITEADGSNTDYRVREDPYVDPNRGDDGTYKFALLTRINER